MSVCLSACVCGPVNTRLCVCDARLPVYGLLDWNGLEWSAAAAAVVAVVEMSE